MPKVGVVTPCHNEEKYIEACIQSVINQTYDKWIHIIVNDGSTDSSEKIIKAYTNKSNKHEILNQSNTGPGPARNKGIRELPSSIKYFICLDGDDLLNPKAIEESVSHMDRSRDTGLLYWKYELVDETGDILKRYNRREKWQKRKVPTTFWTKTLKKDEPYTPIHAVYNHAGIIPSCSIIRKSAYKKTDGYCEKDIFKKGMEDVILFVEMCLKSDVKFVPKELTYYRVHENQISSDKERAWKQGRKLKRYWRKKAEDVYSNHEKLREAIYYGDLRYPTKKRINAAIGKIKKGKLVIGILAALGALWRYCLSLVPPSIGYPMYKKLHVSKLNTEV